MSAGTALVNYTTRVDVQKSIVECSSRLAAAGATAVGTTYTDGQPSGLTFTVDDGTFRMPVDIDQVQRLIARQHRDGRIGSSGMSKVQLLSREHAARVAWRITKDWVAAQCALVEAQLLPLDEVMLAHLVVDDGRTLAAQYRERQRASLEAGTS